MIWACFVIQESKWAGTWNQTVLVVSGDLFAFKSIQKTFLYLLSIKGQNWLTANRCEKMQSIDADIVITNTYFLCYDTLDRTFRYSR